MRQIAKILMMLGVGALVAPLGLALATEGEVSDYQRETISQNCANIRQSLKNLHKADTRTRVFLGTIYQSALTDFITPLNLKLTKANQPITQLTEIQVEFSGLKERFARAFVKYSQALEEVIVADCVAAPEQFYQKLQTARQERERLAETNARLQELLKEHERVVQQKVEALREPAPAEEAHE